MGKSECFKHALATSVLIWRKCLIGTVEHLALCASAPTFLSLCVSTLWLSLCALSGPNDRLTRPLHGSSTKQRASIHNISSTLFEQTSWCTSEQSGQTIYRQPLSGHSTISGQGKGHKQTETQTQPWNKPISNNLEQAAIHCQLSDVVERRTSCQTHFPPISGFVIVFGSNCLIRFGASLYSRRRLVFQIVFRRKSLTASFLQCLRLFGLSFFSTPSHSVIFFTSTACERAPKANTSSSRILKK